MFHFLSTIKKDAGKAVSGVAKASHKTLNFVENTGEDIGRTAKAIVSHPKQAAVGIGKGLAEPFEDIGHHIVSTVEHLGDPTRTERGEVGGSDLVKNQQKAAKNSEYLKAVKQVKGDAGVDATIKAQQMAAKGAKAPEIINYLQKASKAYAAEQKRGVGDVLQIASDVVGGGAASSAVKGATAANRFKKVLTAAKDTAKVGAEAGATSSTGSQLSDKGSVDVKQVFKDALVSGGVGGGGVVALHAVKALPEIVKQAPKVVKAIDDHATNIAANHPAIHQLDDHLSQLNKQRDSLSARNAPESALAANAKAYTSTLKLRQDTINAIKEGGFVGRNDNPGAIKDQITEALTGERSQELDDMEAAGGKLAVQHVTKPGFEAPKTSADFANALLSEGTHGKVSLPSAVVDLLGKTGKAVDSAAKITNFEGARDPQSVLSRYFGKEGSDISYEFSQGAKKRSDLQAADKPLIDRAEKALKKSAKTSVGRADVESRINKALNDRGNADSYLHSPREKEAYAAAKEFYDNHKQNLIKAGKPVRENYAPRVALKDAEDASAGLDYTVNQAFSKNVDAPFLKERTKEELDQATLDKPISMMRNYSSSVSKQLAYEDTMKSLPERLQKVNPIYTLNQTDKQKGRAYLQKLAKDLLQPDIPTSGKGVGKLVGEQAQNKLLNQTYKSALQLSPKFGFINRTQGYATRSQISRAARTLVRKMDKKDLEDLRKNLTSGDNPISGEAGTTAASVGGSKTKMEKVQSRVSGEHANVNHAFDSGAAQHIVDSPIYKQAIKDGKKPAEAAKLALADKDTRELAIRAGNVVTNTTQFGGNIANKPEWLRESGTVLGLSKKWYQQYQRFPLGMMQLLGNVTNPKNARALDIMRRGDPKQTQLVDYLKAARTLQAGLPDAEKAVKAGESKVTPAQIKASKDLLNKSIKTLDKEIKKNSQIRGTKTAKNVAKMWAAASVIQYLFTGATSGSQDKTTGQKVSQSARYGAPVNIPTKDQNPLVPSIPSSPINSHGINKRKLLNFVPVVGPLANRGREVKGLIDALTGGGQ